jgi:hypothetical protein
MILVPFDVTFEHLTLKVCDKLGGGERKIRYKDEDMDLCLMLDQEDLVYALECAGVVWGESKLGGKLELFCE